MISVSLWEIFGNIAASVLYGSFKVEHDEYNRQAAFSHQKQKILDTFESFDASRRIVDLAAGVQWATMFSLCHYAFTAKLAWENHLFFNQNHLWRVTRMGNAFEPNTPLPNNTGENVYYQRRGTLDSQGWTLTFVFDP